MHYPVGDLPQSFTKLTGPCACTLHSNLIPQKMVQMAFCDLSHPFHKQVTNVSQHVFVILLWGILTSPLRAMSPTHVVTLSTLSNNIIILTSPLGKGRGHHKETIANKLFQYDHCKYRVCQRLHNFHFTTIRLHAQ